MPKYVLDDDFLSQEEKESTLEQDKKTLIQWLVGLYLLLLGINLGICYLFEEYLQQQSSERAILLNLVINSIPLYSFYSITLLFSYFISPILKRKLGIIELIKENAPILTLKFISISHFIASSLLSGITLFFIPLTGGFVTSLVVFSIIRPFVRVYQFDTDQMIWLRHSLEVNGLTAFVILTVCQILLYKFLLKNLVAHYETTPE